MPRDAFVNRFPEIRAFFLVYVVSQSRMHSKAQVTLENEAR